VGSPASHRVSRAPCYSGASAVTEGTRFCVQDYHLLWFGFPADFTDDAFVTPYRCPQPPAPTSHSRYKNYFFNYECKTICKRLIKQEYKVGAGFGLVRFRSPLLAESRLISFPAGTEMFQFSALASAGLCIQPAMTPYKQSRVSPFGNPGINSC
jgi:hypothetical protein